MVTNEPSKPAFSKSHRGGSAAPALNVAQRKHRHELVGDADDQHDEHPQGSQMRVRVHRADLVEARREGCHRLQPMQEDAEGVAGGERRDGVVSAFAHRDGQTGTHRQRQPTQGTRNGGRNHIPARHAQQRPGDVIHEKAHAQGEHEAEMPDLFHVPGPEHPDHAGEAHQVEYELHGRELLAVEPGLQRDRHELVHRPHDNGADPAEDEQVRGGDHVLVVVIRRQHLRPQQEQGNPGEQRQQAGDHEPERQGDGGRVRAETGHRVPAPHRPRGRARSPLRAVGVGVSQLCFRAARRGLRALPGQVARWAGSGF